MRRIEQINELLKDKLAQLINQEIHLDNGLITIIYVDTAPNLSEARIGISVLPFKNSQGIVKRLKKFSGYFSKIIQKEIKFRRVPKFKWIIDETEEKAADIESIFKIIREEK